MALRPCFISTNSINNCVIEKQIEFKYYGGFSLSQKQKCVKSLHEKIKEQYSDGKVLEVSSKSDNDLGIKLSAFNLFISDYPIPGKYSVECVFQSSKQFSNGGPFRDLLDRSSYLAKKDERLHNSGDLIRFDDGINIWNLEPKTAFYDWLYIKAINQNTDLHSEVLKYNIFTDIEFNPKKAFNCQARSLAMFVTLKKLDLVDDYLKDKNSFFSLYHEEGLKLF